MAVYVDNETLPSLQDESFCKLVLYNEISNSRVRIWDVIILIPNALFALFLAVRFNKAQLKLRATSSPVYLTFYTLVWGNVVVSIVRCVVSMSVNAAVPLGGMADKVLWIIVVFFLLGTEMSVLTFGLAFGHMDSRSSIRHVLLATSLLSLAFTVTQGVLEFMYPDDTFHIVTRGFDLFGHGGLLFWFGSSVAYALVYLVVLVLPWTRLRDYVALPSKLSFYIYVLTLFLLDATQAAGAALLVWAEAPLALCVVDATSWLYLALYTPLVYRTFLSQLLSVSQPNIMFSYKAQMDEPADDEQVSLPHQQSFSSLKTDSDYIYQSNSVYDSTVLEGGGLTTPRAAHSPDSMASAHDVHPMQPQ